MSAAPGHPSLRARIADALGGVLANHAPVVIARLLGCAGTTVTRRGEDYRLWFGDGLDLAIHHPELAAAVITYLQGETVERSEAVRTIGALMREMREDGELVQTIADALEDGKVDRDEARHILDLIQARRKEEDEDLIPALRAILEAR